MSFQDRMTDWGETPPKKVTPPQCSVCKNLTSDVEWTCKAFPRGIPGDILVGNFDHTNPYPGDNGVRFEPK